MGTKRNRVNVTVPDELDGLLVEYSELTGKSKSSFLLELLEAAKGQLKAVISAEREAEKAKKVAEDKKVKIYESLQGVSYGEQA
ncbi:MAG: hypothetical protein ACPGSM_20720 [Thiolinea sp.]